MTPAQIRSALYCALISESINKATGTGTPTGPTEPAGFGPLAPATLLVREKAMEKDHG